MQRTLDDLVQLTWSAVWRHTVSLGWDPASAVAGCDTPIRCVSESPLEVLPFLSEFQDRVIDLILEIQRDEFGIQITAGFQPLKPSPLR